MTNLIFDTEIKKELCSNKDGDKKDFPFVLKIQLEEEFMINFIKDLQEKYKTESHFLNDNTFEIKLRELDSNQKEINFSSPYFRELGLFGTRKFKRKNYLDFKIITLVDYDPSSSENSSSSEDQEEYYLSSDEMEEIFNQE